MSLRLILASSSPARLATLEAAGVHPIVHVSGVDEEALQCQAEAAAAAATPPRSVSPAERVQLLARAKSHAVAAELDPEEIAAAAEGTPETGAGDPLRYAVVGGDSMFELDGQVYGKPHSAERARARWRRMRGNSGTLHTGHWVIDPLTGRETGAVSSARVRFADVTDDEIDAYVATGEPLEVAGAFTVDGLGGPFVTSVDGDFHGVVGLSLPLVRHLLGDLGLRWTDLWV